jgi:sigma-B regulation protein RsbU (phosphoserine phosphatase)
VSQPFQMMVAPTPPEEGERLAALRSLNVLDTGPEERFDRITQMLTRVFHVPMAYVSLVDADRQWFKSSCGLEDSETPRDISFCGHAILDERVLVIPDALADVRFADNPLVTGPPHIRFYAGQPLRGPGGYNIGTLCIADHRPRHFPDSELETLAALARIVERELNLTETVQLQRELLALKEQAAETERQRIEYLDGMLASQRHLVRELEQAVSYVYSLLPEPLTTPVRTRWHFVPCSQLGGDCFGYFWIDRDHFAVYLLDVCGHGVGAALLSVSVANALRSQALPNTDFRDPARVLVGLNDAFLIEKQDGKYFTIWYGVYDRHAHRLDCASAGHPPALVLTGGGGVAGARPAKPGALHQDADAHDCSQVEAVELGANNLVIGVRRGESFKSASLQLGGRSRLYLFSDGAFEVEKPDGSMMRRKELLEFLIRAGGPCPEDVWNFVRDAAGSRPLRDDFSVLEVQFPETLSSAS